jgi:hypothetical protein
MKKAQCVTVVALDDCHFFFVSQNEKNEGDSKDKNIERKK